MSTPENPAAFPSVCLSDPGHPASVPGMTLRDHFAGQALMGNLANDLDGPAGKMEDIAKHFARMSYLYADAMLAERAKPAQPCDLLAVLIGLTDILNRAESNASGNPEWEVISAKVNAARAAIAKATGV